MRAWNDIMAQHYWYQESTVFDWNIDEEIDDVKENFQNGSYRYFVCRDSETGDIAGLLGIPLSKPEAVIWRWEPAVRLGLETTGIESLLIEMAVELAKENDCTTIRIIQKYPVHRPDSALQLIGIYKRHGFSDPDAPSVGFIMSLRGKEFSPRIPLDVEYKTREGFSDEELADLIVKCFTSTEDDGIIHMKDAGVTDPEVTLIVVSRKIAGGYGESPADCTHLALVDGNLAGVVGSFIREDKYDARVGVLGPVGVLPEYRRMGIASFLVTSALKKLQQMKCLYSAVGTPENNHGAIRMYQRCGFEDRDRLVTLRLQL